MRAGGSWANLALKLSGWLLLYRAGQSSDTKKLLPRAATPVSEQQKKFCENFHTFLTVGRVGNIIREKHKPKNSGRGRVRFHFINSQVSQVRPEETQKFRVGLGFRIFWVFAHSTQVALYKNLGRFNKIPFKSLLSVQIKRAIKESPAESH